MICTATIAFTGLGRGLKAAARSLGLPKGRRHTIHWIFSAGVGGLFGLVMLGSSPAAADPCDGRLPTRSGEAFTGTVRYIGDGDSLCVGPSSDPATWIEVRLADFDAPELSQPDGRRGRDALSRVALGRSASCTAVRGRSGRVVSHDRVIAVCRLGGQSVGDLLRGAGAPAGGN